MDRLQHKAVAAQGHHAGGLVQGAFAVAGDQGLPSLGGDRGGGGHEGDLAGQEPPVFADRGAGHQVAQTRFLCSRTGISRRTLAVRSWSMRAVVQPMPSETWAVTCPHGLTTMEWP